MNRLGRFGYLLRIASYQALDWPTIAVGGACSLFFAGKISRLAQPALSFSLLCAAHRVLMHAGERAGFVSSLRRMLEDALKRTCTAPRVLGSIATRMRPAAAALPFSSNFAIVLKAPRCDHDRVVEKGVLLLKNTDQFDGFRRRIAMASLLERYRLVLEPSWSGYADPRLLAFCAFREHPIVVMSPCRADYEFIANVGLNLIPTIIGAGDWVDPRVFRPLNGQRKRFDAVMIARWNLLKGHHILFRTLSRIGDCSFRVALVANNLKGNNDRGAIMSMIDRYRLAPQIEVFEDLPPEGVNEILNQSKVTLLLSRQEGSNRCLFEGFFAGVPGLAFANHIGIPLHHFTPQTGRLIAPDELPNALLYFREHWAEFDPRSWAMRNIAPEVTTAKLNSLLRELASERCEPWTRDILCKCNRPGLHYYPDEDQGRGLATVQDLTAQFSNVS